MGNTQERILASVILKQAKAIKASVLDSNISGKKVDVGIELRIVQNTVSEFIKIQNKKGESNELTESCKL